MSATRYKLSGAISPRGSGPAICVPAFGSSSDNHTYVQYVGIDDTVILFELVEPSEWEPVRGNPRLRSIEPGHLAIHWVTWSDDLHDSVIDTVEVVRTSVIEKRWLVDQISNPFERLDFAQLSGLYKWFADEAGVCESLLPETARNSWLGETLLLSRARFAVDAVLLACSTPSPIRRKVGLRLRLANTEAMLKEIQDLCKTHASNYITDSDIDAIYRFLQNDVAYRYAKSRLYDQPVVVPVRSNVVRWYKKLTASDAQRKRSGNQRGGITLVAAGFPIDTETYFRREFFGSADWVEGKTRTKKRLETASIRMRTTVFGRELGVLSFNVTYAPNRQAEQDNYTSLLHLGPLSPMFSKEDMSLKWMLLERTSDGTYSLEICNQRPA